MKRTIFAVIALIFTINANCQWYYKKYGVSNLNNLTTEQLQAELKLSKGYTVSGIAISLLGALGIWGGVAIMRNAYDESEWDVGIGHWFGGFFLFMVSISAETVAIVFIALGASRSGEINTILKKIDIKAGLINVPNYKVTPTSRSPVFPGLTLTYNF